MQDNVIDVHAHAQDRSRRRHPSTWPAPDVAREEEDLTARTAEALWRADFEIHYDQHADVTTSGMWILAPVVEAGLRASLPTFQLGETGTGGHLLSAAAKTGDADYVEAMRMFVREEQEHARLLALVCRALEIEMIDSHWTDGIFQVTRRLCGLRTEVLILLVAEFVSLRFYEVLAEGVGDPTLSKIFARIHADESRHLEFHAATLPRHLEQWPAPVWQLARAVWLTTVLGSTVVVAWDHRKVLRACGTGPLRFVRDVASVLGAQQSRFFAPRRQVSPVTARNERAQAPRP